MSKAKPEKDAKKPAPADKDAPHDGGWRETIESIAMAVILALLFRGFVAEAFVIPTGSMAPTLQGRHKDVECPQCHQWYQVSGSREQENDVPTGMHVISTTCPICRYTHVLDPVARPNEGSFSGDRIIVGKFCYDLTDPKRWDVIVFKYPGNAVQNYIKRLIGLPGERVRVVGGNIHTSGADQPDASLQIARKPPGKLNTLLQLVDDTDHIPQQLIDLGWPSRWQATTAGWKALDGGRAFTIAADQPGESWLRYRHLVPSPADWIAIESTKQLPAGVAQRPGQLITDYYAYNTSRELGSDTVPFSQCFLFQSYRPPAQIPKTIGPEHIPSEAAFGQHWVDDLAVECLAQVSSQQGELSLLLVRGGVKHICKIELATGQATLSMTDHEGTALEFASPDGAKTTLAPKAATSVKGAGSYRLRLSNCDHEMLLWVNGSVVKFDAPTTYDGGELVDPYYSPADSGDLAPAGIGAGKGAAVKVSSLRVYRDKYYIATRADNPPGFYYDSDDYDQTIQILQDRNNSTESEAIASILADPALWDKSKSNLFADDNRRYVDFFLEKDQFLPMGDNSPQSYDGRYWWDRDAAGNAVKHHYVERDLLIGKALLIYWPHTWNRPVPFTPNFSRMGPIR